MGREQIIRKRKNEIVRISHQFAQNCLENVLRSLQHDLLAIGNYFTFCSILRMALRYKKTTRIRKCNCFISGRGKKSPPLNLNLSEVPADPYTTLRMRLCVLTINSPKCKSYELPRECVT